MTTDLKSIQIKTLITLVKKTARQAQMCTVLLDSAETDIG